MSIAAEFHGGVITDRNGDELKVFFDESRVKGGKDGALAQVLRCTREIARRLQYRVERFQCEGVFPEDFSGRFRAGAAFGGSRPTWVEGLRAREPGWEEAGTQHVFLAADRLMSLDSQLDPERTRSLLLDRAEAEAAMAREPELAAEFTCRSPGALRDKENRLHAALALEPLATETVRKAA